MPRPLSRRETVVTLAGLGGAGVLSYHATRPAQAATLDLETIDLSGVAHTLAEDASIEDVVMTGSIRSRYESPNIDVDRITARAELGMQAGAPYNSYETTNDHTDVPPNGGEFESAFDVSLLNDWAFQPGDFDPDPGEEYEYRFILIVFVDVFGGGKDDSIANEAWESYATVTVSRDDPGQGADVEFTGEFEFTVEEH